MKKKIVIFSDVHLTSRGNKIIGLNPLQRLQIAIDDAQLNHADADHIVFTGDLSHDGNIESYFLLKDLLQNVKIPVTYMMGNHDCRTNFASVFPSVLFDENGFLQSTASFSSYKCLFLDTLQNPVKKIKKGGGYMCEKRLAWLQAQLSLAQKESVILFMHHPAFPVGFKGMDSINLANSDEFFSLLKKYQNVSYIIAGHIHLTISGNFKGYGFSIFKSTCHQMPLMLDSENIKVSAAEPPGYGVLILRTDGITVHSQDYELHHSNKTIFDDYN